MQGEFVIDIPAKDGKNNNLFYSVVSREILYNRYRVGWNSGSMKRLDQGHLHPVVLEQTCLGRESNPGLLRRRALSQRAIRTAYIIDIRNF